MRIDFEFVELHAPLFIAGTNFGLKLYDDEKRNSKGGLEMWYDTDLRQTVIVYKNKVAMIDTYASATLKTPAQIGVMLPTVTIVTTKSGSTIAFNPVKAQATGPEKTFSAQVSTPISQPPKKPGRPAKYQGEESQGE